MSGRRVLQILHSLEVGGAETMAVVLASGLSSSIDFRFVCLDGLGPLAETLGRDGIPVDCLERAPGFDRSVIAGLRSLVREWRPQVVHAHQCTPWTYTLLARGTGAAPPLLLTEHGRFFPDRRSWPRILINRLLMRRSDVAVAVGRSVAEALRRNEGIAPSRTRVIYNGISLDRFRPRDGQRDAAKRAWGVEGRFVVSIAARLDPIKDHLTAIRACHRLAASGDDCCLLVAGEGPERPALEREIDRLGLAERVRLLGSVEDVPGLLAASDVALLSSVSEGIPLFLIEAMASAVPVVATRVGGVPEVVDHDRQGLLFPAGDVEALAETLSRLRTEPELRRRLGEAGPERARERFSLDAMLGAYDDLYRRLAAGLRR